HLLRALLPSHIEDGETLAAAAQLSSQLERQGRLANARLAAEENNAPGYETPTEYAIKFANSRSDARSIPRVHVAQSNGRGLVSREGTAKEIALRRALRPDGLFHQGRPGAAARTSSEPARLLGATFRTRKDRSRASHAGILPAFYCQPDLEATVDSLTEPPVASGTPKEAPCSIATPISPSAHCAMTPRATPMRAGSWMARTSSSCRSSTLRSCPGAVTSAGRSWSIS